jgi:DNA mismatch repair protein MutL
VLLIRSVAAQHAIRPGQQMTPAEMQDLIDKLFACSQPQATPAGRATFLIFRLEELSRMFRNP